MGKGQNKNYILPYIQIVLQLYVIIQEAYSAAQDREDRQSLHKFINFSPCKMTIHRLNIVGFCCIP